MEMCNIDTIRQNCLKDMTPHKFTPAGKNHIINTLNTSIDAYKNKNKSVKDYIITILERLYGGSVYIEYNAKSEGTLQINNNVRFSLEEGVGSIVEVKILHRYNAANNLPFEGFRVYVFRNAIPPSP